MIAKFSWWPNADAIRWLLREVLPQLPADCVRLNLFGADSERWSRDDLPVTGHGFIPDLDTAWAQTDLVVCPTVSGGGLNIKLVEALYNRMPVLATPRAVRGLPDLHDAALVVADGATAWCRFLQSADALKLAARRPDAETAAQFSLDRAVTRLSGILDQLEI